jgi:hypothetical protein
MRALREAIHRWKYEGKIGLSPIFGNGWQRGFLIIGILNALT